MVRKPNASAASRQPAPHPPDIQVMTEAQALHALEEENRVLRERLAALEDEQFRTQNPTPSPIPTPIPPVPTPPPIPFLEPKIDPPPEFDGKVSEYATFLDHCEFYFDNKPSMFLNNEKNKVSLVISRLRGRAAAWAHALRRTNPANPAFLSWLQFRALMNSLLRNYGRYSL